MTRTGILEGQIGMQDALYRVAADGWALHARIAIEVFIRAGVTFTAEDVRARAGDPAAPNALGAVIHAAAHDGLIEIAGSRRSTRPDARGRRLLVWRAAR